eukprot:TRINITY_DN93557_c0_g1_i1.p1 TRINITY_DN93557_c0_g1~~TRINITY_DN93557_c0_g1_i1.p1  ORF type:complete len:754 (-),score=5.81 TRINITY_DN93557_c0_g1_i1:245-2506(-)
MRTVLLLLIFCTNCTGFHIALKSDQPAFVTRRDNDSDPRSLDSYTGYMVEAIKHLTKNTSFANNITVTWFNSSVGFTPLIELIEQGNYDMGVGDIIIRRDRMERVIFTDYVYLGSVSVMVKARGAEEGLLTFFKPFMSEVWVVVVVGIVTIGVALWLGENWWPRDVAFSLKFKGGRHIPRGKAGLGEGLWFGMSLPFGTEWRSPRAPGTAFAIIMWQCAFFIFAASYTGNLVASLDDPSLQVRTTQDVLNWRVGVHPNVEPFARKAGLHNNIQLVHTPEEGAAALENKTLDALLMHTTPLLGFTSVHKGYYVVGQEWLHPMAFALPKTPFHRELATNFTKLIVQLRDAEYFTQLGRTFLPTLYDDTHLRKHEPFRTEELGGVLLVAVSGCVIAIGHGLFMEIKFRLGKLKPQPAGIPNDSFNNDSFNLNDSFTPYSKDVAVAAREAVGEPRKRKWHLHSHAHHGDAAHRRHAEICRRLQDLAIELVQISKETKHVERVIHPHHAHTPPLPQTHPYTYFDNHPTADFSPPPAHNAPLYPTHQHFHSNMPPPGVGPDHLAHSQGGSQPDDYALEFDEYIEGGQPAILTSVEGVPAGGSPLHMGMPHSVAGMVPQMPLVASLPSQLPLGHNADHIERFSELTLFTDGDRGTHTPTTLSETFATSTGSSITDATLSSLPDDDNHPSHNHPAITAHPFPPSTPNSLHHSTQVNPGNPQHHNSVSPPLTSHMLRTHGLPSSRSQTDHTDTPYMQYGYGY